MSIDDAGDVMMDIGEKENTESDSPPKEDIDDRTESTVVSNVTVTTETVEYKDLECVWEYELSVGQWARYEQKIIDKLNGASPTDVIEEEMNEWKLSIDLSIMKQVNMGSGFRKNLRCAVQKKGDESHYVWERMCGRRYTPLPYLASMALENALSNEQSDVVIEVDGQNWNVSVENMLATVPGAAKEVKIRRSVSKAVSAMEASPAPSVERSRTMTKRSAASVDYKAEIKIEKDEEDDDDVVVAPKKSRTKSVAKPKSGSGIKGAPGVFKSTKRTIIVKGRAPVDPECEEKVHTAHVLEEGDTIYDAMLNQTNIANNNNKYYIMQILEDDAVKQYSVWFRWGRVGYKGQCSLQHFAGNLEGAKNAFCKKFEDKTRNEWADRDNFEPVHGKYTLIAMDYSVPANTEPEVKEEEGEEETLPPVESVLDKRIASLLQLICNIRTMEESVMEMEYDSAKAPLGKLTKQQISEGYSLLKDIEKCIKKKSFGREFMDAMNAYYTKIPHSFGFQQPPLIKTEEALKKEAELLEMLEEIECAIRVLGMVTKNGKGDRRPLVDQHYENMKCEMKALDRQDDDYKMVDKYLSNTHANTHFFKMKLLNVYEVKKEGEEGRFKEHLGNKKLLWHGSRLTNWYGILSHGLKIAPPEAPMTGYMFGKGVYFADVASKSGNYCYPTSGRTGLLCLAEVALGESRTMCSADYDANKNDGKHSTIGLGKSEPNPEHNVIWADNVCVPLGPMVDVKRKNKEQCQLLYNEYIVYNTDQIKLRYLVEVEFDM